MDEKTAALMQSRIDRLVKTVNYEKADRIPLVAWRSDYMINYFGLEQRDMNFENMVQLIITMILFKWAIALFDTPFMILATRIKNNELE